MIKNNSIKILAIFIAFIFILSIATPVFASNIVINTIGTSNEIQNSTINNSVISNTTMEVVEDTVCHIDIDDVAEFEKQITEFNETEKSVTLTLDITNIKSVQETQSAVEIFFVIDNSSSMTEAYIGDKTRKQAVIDSANSLIEKLYQSNPNIEIGIVGFSSLDSSQGETEGTINDASLELGLSNSKTEVQNAVTNLANLEVGPRTNIEAGLTIAQNNFSDKENVNRYVVLLTDGVPNNAIDGTTLTYSGVVATRTKNKLEELEATGIKVISAMINLNGEEIEPTTNKSYKELSEEIFGTEENPTISKYFYIPDGEIEDTIVNDIFESLTETVDNTLRNITITDYFPKEIIDNFDFEYVATPNIGTVSQTIDKTNNSITWNIELLSEGETASLSYKLTLKDDYDIDIVEQILKTNTHVDITGEHDGTNVEKTSEDSPTIRVKYTPPADNTISNEILPQTGETSGTLVILALVVIAIVAYVRIRIIKNK